MTNSEIVEKLEEAVSYMELLEHNSFKISAYRNVIQKIERTSKPIRGFSREEMGTEFTKSMTEVLVALMESESFPELDQLEAKIPAGVRSMLKINGIGPKKVATLWKEAGITTLSGLRTACESSQVSQLKGFGGKIQDTILSGISFLESVEGKLLMHHAEALAMKIENRFREMGIQSFERVGDLETHAETVTSMEYLFPVSERDTIQTWLESQEDFEFRKSESGPFHFSAWYFPKNARFCFFFFRKDDHIRERFVLNSNPGHWKAAREKGIPLYTLWQSSSYQSEEELYKESGRVPVPEEIRTGLFEWEPDFEEKLNRLIRFQDLRGCVHNHSQYSDGKNTLEEMALWCMDQGWEYFGIADHSRSAQYAQGLFEERVVQQWQEIDRLNRRWEKFRILKGIESDILGDGSLDYEADILEGFDYVVASVHSVLRMDKETATHRLIRAIENPYTRILGHCSGRLLLKRPGYPLDYQKIIDACIANGVAIELNAHPSRLDMDWQNLYQALEKGAIVSINPDAHTREDMAMMKYGVWLARKAGAETSQVLNAMDLPGIQSFFNRTLAK